MNIMYAGHFDRSYLLGSKNNRFCPVFSAGPAQAADKFAPYRSFFHCAGMISLLSDAYVVRPDRSPAGERVVSHRGRDGRVYDSILRAELEDDTLRLAKLAVMKNAFSNAAVEAMRLRAPEDPHEPNLVHHVEGILWAILDAWQTRATLILADCDRRVLVELVECVIANGIALPFGIPDFRTLKLSNSRKSGVIANLAPGDWNSLAAWRENPAIQIYRRRVSRLAESRTVNVGTLLQSALEEAQLSDPHIREAPTDIRLTSTWVRTIDTIDLNTVLIDPFHWTDRKPSKPTMHIIVMQSPPNP